MPFFGQGANCAFEDCVELDRSLTAAGGDWPTALARYEAQRKPNADAIADMALENFVEMSERVASPVFRGQTRLRHALERALGGRYVSRYELVSFTTIPYAEIEGRIRRQDRTVGAVAGAMLLAAVGAGALLLRRMTRSTSPSASRAGSRSTGTCSSRRWATSSSTRARRT